MTWLDWVDFGLENQFNPRVALGSEAEKWLSHWQNESIKRKNELNGKFDIKYGDHPLMSFDLHPGKNCNPVIINIHGGYWRALDKCFMNHHLADLAEGDFGLANMNYPLCPEFTLTQIMDSLNIGIKKVVKTLDDGKRKQPIILMGHSAGAHMAMHLTHHDDLSGRLAGVIALSGIYEPELVLNLQVNDDVRLSEESAKRWNCLKNLPAKGPAFYIAVGGSEPPGWIDQSWIMADLLSSQGNTVEFHVCSNRNHFNLVDSLCNPTCLNGRKLHRWISDFSF